MEATPDLNVKVENTTPTPPKSVDGWRIVERIGVAVVLLILLGNHFMRQDSSKQEFIQQQASEISTQAKLDRQEERLNAQKTQEKLVEVITSQVAATVEQTAAAKESRAAIEQTADTNVKVAESLNEFSDTAKNLVDRVDRLVDHVEQSEPKQ